jgi:curved DNA-binding protein CbpA
MVYHPDKNKNDVDKDKFKEIAHAYDILSDPEKRYKYDQASVQSASCASTSYSTHFSYAVQKQYHQRQKQQQQKQEESKKPKKTRPRRPQQNPFKKTLFNADDFFGSDAATRKEEK